jgi:predicted ribonuclease YlaK
VPGPGTDRLHGQLGPDRYLYLTEGSSGMTYAVDRLRLAMGTSRWRAASVLRGGLADFRDEVL